MLTFKLRDLDLAEDVLQDAIVLALTRWPESGQPANPKAWLYKVAMNKAIDSFRHRKTIDGHYAELIIHSNTNEHDVGIAEDLIPDERLRMIFTCCHPAINQSSQIALALRTLCGLNTSEIARAFIVSEPTMAQRLVRTKRKIRDAGIPFEVPEQGQLKERIQSVLGVIYLIYNEGYNASSGDNSIRHKLCIEAQYLASCLISLLPDHAEVHGLHALLLLHDSRRKARLDKKGNLKMLGDQNRTLWDKDMIRAGFNSLRVASALNDTGPYQLQAAISAVHAQSESIETTNWKSIVELYTALHSCTPNNVIALNRCVAISYAYGAGAALAQIEQLDLTELDSYQPYHAAIADIHRRAGNLSRASSAYQRAIELSGNKLEHQFLTQQLEKLSESCKS